jgi:hypothetical protein
VRLPSRAASPGPRLIETAELFAAAIHPELFSAYAQTARSAAKLSAVDNVAAT